MLVTPPPVCLLIVVAKPGKFLIFAMVLFCPHTIRAIFMAIPVMIVVMLLVMVSAIVGEQRCWRYRDRGHQGGRQQGRIQKSGHAYSPQQQGGNWFAKHSLTADGE